MSELKRSAKHSVKISFTQVYIRVGVSFPFSFKFQKALADAFQSAARPSPQFLKKYGDDWNVCFFISAKRDIKETEIRGPGTSRTKKRQEWTLFLPFDSIQREPVPLRAACIEILSGAASVLERIGVDAGALRLRFDTLSNDLVADPAHFDDHD